jgi:hypothetical protein
MIAKASVQTKTIANSSRFRKTSLTLALISGILLALFGGLALGRATAAPSFNNVQIFVQPSSSIVNTFSIVAYNLTGSLVASSQSQFPAFGFELPSGTYLFAVTATEFVNYPVPYALAGANTPPAQSGIASGRASSFPICLECPYKQPAVEYGYSLQSISSSTTLTIQTQNVTKIPTSTITIHVTYANGSVAPNTSVSAWVVGGGYYWYQPRLSMWNTTDSAGIAHLVVPAAPVEVSAWKWVPVILPKNQSMVTTTVGGEKVNVTVYWQPAYVGLAGSTLIIPPQTSASITLHVQKPNYWVMPYGAQYAVPNGSFGKQATVTNLPGGVPALQYQNGPGGSVSGSQGGPVQQIPPIQATQNPASNQSQILIIATAAAVVLASISVIIVAVRFAKP